MKNNKKYDYGMIVGKFSPIHIGHEKLIDKSLEICNKTLIIVTNSKNDTIDIYKRINLIKKIYSNEINLNKLDIVEFKNPTVFNLKYGDLLFEKYFKVMNNYPEVVIYGSDKDISFCFRKELIEKLTTIVVKRDDVSSTKVRTLLKENKNIKIKEMINEKIIKDIDKSILK